MYSRRSRIYHPQKAKSTHYVDLRPDNAMKRSGTNNCKDANTLKRYRFDDLAHIQTWAVTSKTQLKLLKAHSRDSCCVVSLNFTNKTNAITYLQFLFEAFKGVSDDFKIWMPDPAHSHLVIQSASLIHDDDSASQHTPISSSSKRAMQQKKRASSTT